MLNDQQLDALERELAEYKRVATQYPDSAYARFEQFLWETVDSDDPQMELITMLTTSLRAARAERDRYRAAGNQLWSAVYEDWTEDALNKAADVWIDTVKLEASDE